MLKDQIINKTLVDSDPIFVTPNLRVLLKLQLSFIGLSVDLPVNEVFLTTS